ncbi:MAG: hypothetical protein LBH46_00515 [Rickettsiales bacterium]|nr:hypothetical protein [Rickettsiales bacterium]
MSNRSNIFDTILFKKDNFNKGHFNQGMYQIKYEKDNEFFYIFCLCWFNSNIFQNYINNVGTGAAFKEIRIYDVIKKAKIPLFSQPIQQQIAQEYYNSQPQLTNSTLQQEKDRNKQLGIFQLNMEIFKLKDELNNLLDKIINDEL